MNTTALVGGGLFGLLLLGLAASAAEASPWSPGLAAQLHATLKPFEEQFWSTEQKLAACDPRLRVPELLERLRARGFQPTVTYTWRTLLSQDSLVRQAKTPATWSLHCAVDAAGRPASLAVDLVDKRYGWSPTDPLLRAQAAEFFRQVGVEAAGMGLGWGGLWSRESSGWSDHKMGWDPGHVEVRVETDSTRTACLLNLFGPGEDRAGPGGYTYRIWRNVPHGPYLQILAGPQLAGRLLLPVANAHRINAILAELANRTV